MNIVGNSLGNPLSNGYGRFGLMHPVDSTGYPSSNRLLFIYQAQSYPQEALGPAITCGSGSSVYNGYISPWGSYSGYTGGPHAETLSGYPSAVVKPVTQNALEYGVWIARQDSQGNITSDQLWPSEMSALFSGYGNYSVPVNISGNIPTGRYQFAHMLAHADYVTGIDVSVSGSGWCGFAVLQYHDSTPSSTSAQPSSRLKSFKVHAPGAELNLHRSMSNAQYLQDVKIKCESAVAYHAFTNCVKLSSIYMEGKIASMEKMCAFDYLLENATVNLASDSHCDANSAFYQCDRLTSFNGHTSLSAAIDSIYDALSISQPGLQGYGMFYGCYRFPDYLDCRTSTRYSSFVMTT